SESARWQRMLDELEGYLAQVQSMDGPFIKMNFLFGTLSVAQFFEFQEAHVAYHEHYFPNS
ncbi:MAG TPA: hypothetical protein VG944_14050, partial [Fimbriimonas sp.]|nr:hypothetical protein [Fimbriimonas sp.]